MMKWSLFVQMEQTKAELEKKVRSLERRIKKAELANDSLLKDTQKVYERFSEKIRLTNHIVNNHVDDLKRDAVKAGHVTALQKSILRINEENKLLKPIKQFVERLIVTNH